ncbi:MAG: FmdB family zinc ribbon protein [Gemmatimonadales bacterium]
MPTYHYRCPEGHDFDKFEKISARGRAKCPVCGRPAVRQISGGAGLVFKGSGFYITDYGKDGKGARKPESEPKPTEPAKSESTPRTPKPESRGGSSAGKPKAE